MDSRELLPNSSREGIVNGIPVPPAATAEEFPVDGHRERWENFDNAFEMPIGGCNMPKLPEDIDPQGLYRPLAWQYLGPQAPDAMVIPQPVVIPVRSPIALRYDAEFLRLELALANYLLAQAIEDSTDRALQQGISAPGIDMNTATPAPFIVPMPENVADVASTAPIEISIPKLLVVSSLEPIRRQEPAAVEKVLENVEVIVVHSKHNSSDSFIEGSSSSGSSQQ